MIRCFAAAIVAAGVLWGSPAQGQPVSLDTAIGEIRGGDPLRGLATLNEILKQSPNSPQLASIHAYRALAYARMDQPERARAAAVQALQANPNLVLGPPDFSPDLVAMFDRLRGPAPSDPGAAAAAAEAAGRWQDAFNNYVAAYRALPDPAPLADDRRLRERIITMAQKLTPPPGVPSEARASVEKAQSLLDADALLGKSSGNAAAQAAAVELRKAVRAAPWWGEAAFKLATQLQKLQLVEEALLNVSMYKLADPKGYAASLDAANPRASAAPAAAASAPVTGAPGTIIVYRPAKFVGGARRMKIECNGIKVADLQNGRMVTLQAPPGSYQLKIQGKESAIVVVPGGEYYFRAGPGAMGVSVRSVLPDEAKGDLKESDIKPNDTKSIYFQECKP